MFEWIVLVIVVAVIIVICEVRIGKSKEFFEKEKRSIESMWKARIENEHKLQDEVRKGLKSDLENSEKHCAKLQLDALELKSKLDKEFNANNELREENSKLKEEYEKLQAKRKHSIAVKKALPKRPKKGERERIIQYVKDVLSSYKIAFKEKNKTNGLLSVADGLYEIYCGTELYINKQTMEKKHGLKNMIREINKIGKGKK
ncbi:MAG: hypothetical protein J6C46_11425 [Clostridia bacterium]|nr:hypothetical protein [Clostridia bacterium]